MTKEHDKSALEPGVNKLGPPKFGIISQQTILGEMSSLSSKLYIYIYIYIKRKTSPAAKFKSAFAGWHRARDTHVFKALRIITNPIRFCWAYECKDQSEAFRWVIAEAPLFHHHVRWLTEFSGEFSHQKQQVKVYECKQDINFTV